MKDSRVPGGIDAFAHIRLRIDVGADGVKRRLPAGSRIHDCGVEGAQAVVCPQIIIERAVLLEKRVFIEEHVRHKKERAAPFEIMVNHADFGIVQVAGRASQDNCRCVARNVLILLGEIGNIQCVSDQPAFTHALRYAADACGAPIIRVALSQPGIEENRQRAGIEQARNRLSDVALLIVACGIMRNARQRGQVNGAIGVDIGDEIIAVCRHPVALRHRGLFIRVDVLASDQAIRFRLIQADRIRRPVRAAAAISRYKSP